MNTKQSYKYIDFYHLSSPFWVYFNLLLFPDALIIDRSRIQKLAAVADFSVARTLKGAEKGG